MAGFLRTIAQGIGSGLNRMAVGSTGGLLKPGEPGSRERRQNIGAGLSDIGYLISSRGLGGSPYSQQLAGNRQAEQQALLAKKKEQQALAQQQEVAATMYGGITPEALREAIQVKVKQGDIEGASKLTTMLKSLTPEAPAPAKPISKNDIVPLTNGRFGIPMSDGQVIELPESVTLENFDDIYENVGGALFDKKAKKWELPPKAPTLSYVNGSPARANPDGSFSRLNGEMIPADSIRSVGDVPDNASDATFQALVEKHGGNVQSAAKEYNSLGGGSKYDSGTVAAIGEGIMNGSIPPDMSRMYGLSGPVRAYLAERGFDLSSAQLEFGSATRRASSLNSPQMVRLESATRFVNEGLDLMKQASDDLTAAIPRGQFPVLNMAAVNAAMQGGLGQKAQIAATRFNTMMNLIIPEVATVLQGGYAVSDDARETARGTVSNYMSGAQIDAALDLIRQDMNLRVKSLRDSTSTNTVTGREFQTPAMKQAEEAKPKPTKRWNPQTGRLEAVQ